MNLSRTDHIISEILLSPKFRYLRHILLQATILLITANIFWDTPNSFIFTNERLFAWILFFITINAIIYSNLYIFVPRLLFRNRIGSYLLSICSLIFGLIVVNGVADSFISDIEAIPVSPTRIALTILSSFLSISLIVAGINALLLFRYWMVYTLRAEELESATLRSELAFLKNQINPHFLFNMLNNANVLVKRDGDEASRVLLKLEDLLRYQINDSSKEWVPLVSDIHFLNDFLNLEKVRRDQFEYTIAKEGKISGTTIPPLLFIPFVENATKHNTDGNSPSYVHLSFRVWDNQLCFSCENSKPLTTPMNKTDVGGIGQKNIRRRLELLYPGRHRLEIEETEKKYIVKLHLDL